MDNYLTSYVHMLSKTRSSIIGGSKRTWAVVEPILKTKNSSEILSYYFERVPNIFNTSVVAKFRPDTGDIDYENEFIENQIVIVELMLRSDKMKGGSMFGGDGDPLPTKDALTAAASAAAYIRLPGIASAVVAPPSVVATPSVAVVAPSLLTSTTGAPPATNSSTSASSLSVSAPSLSVSAPSVSVSANTPTNAAATSATASLNSSIAAPLPAFSFFGAIGNTASAIGSLFTTANPSAAAGLAVANALTGAPASSKPALTVAPALTVVQNFKTTITDPSKLDETHKYLLDNINNLSEQKNLTEVIKELKTLDEFDVNNLLTDLYNHKNTNDLDIINLITDIYNLYNK